MVDRRTLYRPGRPCVVAALAESGLRVLVPDLRGHGDSGPTPSQGGDWTYDDLVSDVGTYIDLARRLEPGEPVVLVGHSLFAHNALACLGRRPEAPVAALVLLAASLWMPQWSSRRLVWAARRAVVEAVWGIARLAGRVPARRAGAGSADEAIGYWRDFRRFARSGRWAARDGWDYAAALGRIGCPVLHVVSRGDRLAPPADALALSAALGVRRSVWRLGEAGAPAELGAVRPPGHMEIVTSDACAPVWRAVGQWIVSTAATADPARPPRRDGGVTEPPKAAERERGE
jgi:pimeloyl-ACP methyl ester carboxylesterase